MPDELEKFFDCLARMKGDIVNPTSQKEFLKGTMKEEGLDMKNPKTYRYETIYQENERDDEKQDNIGRDD